MAESITSRKNEKITHLKKLGSSAAYRREHGETVCDGLKLLNEAASHGMEIKTVLFSDGEPSVPENAAVYSVPYELIESVSPMQSPQRVFFSCAIPETGGIENTVGSCIILENIQDPGNVGTMIRTANAFSIDTVVLTGACADPFAPKTIRASMGAVFRQRIVRADADELVKLRENGRKIYGAALSERSTDIRNTDLKGAAVIIGNEGSGITEETLALCDGEIIIPMNPDCESLNAGAAAAVVMWEMRKASLSE